LADQYNRLDVGEFHVLPYPVSREFASENFDAHDRQFDESDLADAIQSSETAGVFGSSSTTPFGQQVPGASEAVVESIEDILAFNDFADLDLVTSHSPSDHVNRPLRMTCPGEVRREKGHVDYLQPLVDEIYETQLATGNVQIIVQRPARKWHSKKQKIELRLPGEEHVLEDSVAPIEYFSHPLSQQDYVQLIKNTDCGLLFYDSRVYFSRRAGVLGELLSCGKPVIVPAGSWLAEQIQEPIFQHVDNLIDGGQVTRTIAASEFAWNSRNVPASGGVLSFDQGQYPFEFSVNRNPEENFLALKFDWHWPDSPGIYCRIKVLQTDVKGNEIKQDVRVVGFRDSLRQVNSLYCLHPATRAVKFSLSNAFHDSNASIKRASVQGLASVAGGQTNHEVPVGQVGVIASDQSDLPNCVDEIVKHFEHYRNSAQAFSGQWYARHEPKRTVSRLISVGQTVSRAA
jgi:hypothetical protein